MSVYKAISQVQKSLLSGIGKNSRNSGQGFNFRGIDDVYNSLSPALVEAGLVILPRVISRETTERQSARGGVLIYTTLQVEFDFVAAEDGSKHTVATVGEAMDSGDKGTNKAMSAAYKYACFQTFCIPVENVDADAETYEVAANITEAQAVELGGLIQAKGVEMETFLKFYGAATLATFPAARYGHAIGALAKKEDKQ